MMSALIKALVASLACHGECTCSLVKRVRECPCECLMKKLFGRWHSRHCVGD